MKTSAVPNSPLAASITRSASAQTYYTIRFLVDKPLVEDAYRAYAYFRWVDNRLDQEGGTRAGRLAFLQRQQTLVEGCYQGDFPSACSMEEGLLVDLIRRHPLEGSGLHSYIQNMMEVMAFDTARRGRLVCQAELSQYTHWLAVAVTEALHYFIGHDSYSPNDQSRYLAVTGAHITHMLRDTLEDVKTGYYNAPKEVLSANSLAAWDVEKPAYREWVKEAVQQARHCFEVGREYLSRVENGRCRLAGYAYIHRFEIVLKSIEREGYVLRRAYPERKSFSSGVDMLGWALWMAMRFRKTDFVSNL